MHATNREGKIIGVFGTKGGAGRTILACNLAVALKNPPDRLDKPDRLGDALVLQRHVLGFQGRFGQRLRARQDATGARAEEQAVQVILVSLDLDAGGDLPVILGLNPSYNLGDLAAALDAPSLTSPEEYLVKHPSGLKVLPGPASRNQADLINAGHLKRLLNLLRDAYDYVVLDMMPSFDPLMRMVLDYSDLVLLVSAPDVPGIKHLTRDLETCRFYRIPETRLEVVINRTGGRGSIEVHELQASLQKRLLESIPCDEQVVTVSLNEGVPFVLANPQSRVSLAVKKLASKVVKILGDGRPPGEEQPKAVGDNLSISLEQTERATIPEQPSGPGIDLESPRRVATELIELKLKTHQRVIERLDGKEIDLGMGAAANAIEQVRGRVRAVAFEVVEELATQAGLTREIRDRLVCEIVDEILGLGHLEGFLRDPEITEIMVNGPFQVYVERRGKLELTDKVFINDAQVMRIIERIVSPLGRRVDESSPMVDARLPDGSRVNAIIPPLALNGPILTIRKFSPRPYTAADLIRFGSLSAEMATFLQKCVEGRKNIIVSGGTGSGKTTLLNVLSAFIPAQERILTIEDAAELRLQQQHVGRLEARPSNIEGKGAVTIRDLVRNALRMRPDRIIVGEVRGGEALDMLQAMNTGHNGSLTTIHANSPRDVLSRLETMVLMAGMDLPVRAIREQIASAIDLIVQQSRIRDGSRKITRITEVVGMEGEVITTQDLFTFEEDGTGKEGFVKGVFRSTGLRASFADASFSVQFPLIAAQAREEG